jgi:hypothetical protein
MKSLHSALPDASTERADLCAGESRTIDGSIQGGVMPAPSTPYLLFGNPDDIQAKAEQLVDLASAEREDAPSPSR